MRHGGDDLTGLDGALVLGISWKIPWEWSEVWWWRQGEQYLDACQPSRTTLQGNLNEARVFISRQSRRSWESIRHPMDGVLTWFPEPSDAQNPLPSQEWQREVISLEALPWLRQDEESTHLDYGSIPKRKISPKISLLARLLRQRSFERCGIVDTPQSGKWRRGESFSPPTPGESGWGFEIESGAAASRLQQCQRTEERTFRKSSGICNQSMPLKPVKSPKTSLEIANHNGRSLASAEVCKLRP